MEQNYIFPMLWDKEGDQYNIWFPDIEEAFTFADSTDEIDAMAKDVLELSIHSRQLDNEPIPTPTSYEDIAIPEGANLYFIKTDMERFKREQNMRKVRKNVMIPQWVDVKAQKQNVNFSKVLTDALIEQLS